MIPLVDLKAQYDSIRREIIDVVQNVMDSGQFILGSEVEAFEREIAEYCQTTFAIGVASGTDALKLALLACGIKEGDEVITTPFTFIATTEAIVQCGATPVFVDIEPDTFNIDPQKIEQRITRKTKAILPVHLFGHPCEMDTILDLAKTYKLKVIEDCAQAFGAMYKGMMVGSLSDVGCLSFFPSKVLGAYGDGGMVVTNNPEITEKVFMLRNHGCKEKYYHTLHGFNSRLDEIQAAILRVKLKYVDRWIRVRRSLEWEYSQEFGGIKSIQVPYVNSIDCYHIYNYYTIRAKKRDKLQKYLGKKGIATAIYYPLSLHLQPVYKYLGYKLGDFPESEKAQHEVLSLPLYPELKEEQINKVVEAIKEFYA